MKKSDYLFLTDIFVRYILIFFAGLFNLYIFYLIFTPLTYEALFLITRLFSSAILLSDGIMVNGIFFAIVSACVGGSAYYLLFILAMSTREIKTFKRIKLILFLFIVLFVFNILRMLFMIYIYGEVYFELIHWIFWYLISTVFVFLEWILAIRVFRIKTIPVYSDIVTIAGKIKSGKKQAKKKKKTRKRN